MKQQNMNVYIDGGCAGNHLTDITKRKAGYGIYLHRLTDSFPKCFFLTKEDVDKPLEKGEKIFFRSESLMEDSEKPKTNNRAELMAAIRFFELWKRNHFEILSTDDIVIVCDSQLVFLTATQYLQKWRKQNYRKADGQEVANVDLVKRLDVFLQHPVVQKRVTWKHMNSHLKEPSQTKDRSLWIDWNGNNNADILANAALGIFSKQVTNDVGSKETVGEKRKASCQ